ncbi:hypothetical protein AD998_10065 [bacterium 336/3]|nr:hypothetical protein AD998_10065 [bacterium 336/3]
MERDLKVFETMLKEYFYRDNDQNPFNSKEIQTEYFEGFGVIVKVYPLGKNIIDLNFQDLEDMRHIQGQGHFMINTDIEIPEMPEFPNMPELKELKDLNGKTIIINGEEIKVLDGHSRKHARKEIENARKNVERSRKEMERSRKEVERSRKEIELSKKEYEMTRKEYEKERKEFEKRKEEIMKEREEMRQTILKKRDSLMEVNNKALEEKLRAFLTQYADLLTELKTNERIRIMYVNDSNMSTIEYRFDRYRGGTVEEEKVSKNQTFLEITKSDIDAYKSNKISEKEFQNKIKKSQLEKNDKKEMSIDLMGSVLDKLLVNIEKENTEFKSIGRVQSFYLEDFGVKYDGKIFHKKLREREEQEEGRYESTYDEENGVVKVEMKYKTKDAKELKKIEEKNKEAAQKREKEVAKYHEELEKLGKEYLVSYGKTLLNTLKNNEKLIWEITFVEPRDFDAAKKAQNIILSVSRQTLEQYDNKQLTLEQAMSQVKVDKK